jgi:hypothetical protein
MSQTGTIANWLFGLLCAASIGILAFSLERMRTQINLFVPPQSQVNWCPPRASSIEELFSKSHVLGYYLGIITLHRESYPSSALPTFVGIAIGGCIVGFIGIVMSRAIN